MESLRSAAPRVTVLLPVHDAERFLAEAVESVLAQSFRDFELLAIDDGSRDASAEILGGFARRGLTPRMLDRLGFAGGFLADPPDGFGFADTRPAARRFFQIDAQSVVVQALQALADRGEVKPEVVQEAFDKYRIDDPTAVRGVKQEGGDA